MKAVRDDVQLLQTKVGEIECAAAKAIFAAETQMTTDLRRDVTKIIEEKLARTVMVSHDDSVKAVYGGLENLSYQAAEEWITVNMEEFSLPKPSEIYRKGNEFKGTVFAKFPNADAMRQAVQRMHRNPSKVRQAQVWCKPNRPIDERLQIAIP